jgi:starch synthase
MGGDAPTVAVLPWGDRFEDFHDKIGISLEAFRDELTGGWLFNYVDALRSAGVRTILIYASARVSAPVRFTHAPTGVPVCILPAPRLHQKVRGAANRLLPGSTVLRSLASYLATPVRLLARELRREHCAAILCQEYEYARFDVCVLLGRWLRLPVFATYQGADRPVSRLEGPFRRLALRGCAGLIVAAQTETRRIHSRYRVPTVKVGHIPNPMDVVAWQPADRAAARAELGIPAAARVVVWHGRVQIERKGLDVLLDAWQRVCTARPGAELLLLLIGSGRDDDRLRRRISSTPPGTVRWVDRYVRDRIELWRHLSAADAATLASRHEGFAVAVVEAMACALPVVVTDVPGTTDILEDGEQAGGLVVPRDDAVALAAALGRVLDDPVWARRLGARARQRAEQEFALEAVGQRLRRFMASRGALDRAR